MSTSEPEKRKRKLEKEAVLHCHKNGYPKFTLAVIFKENRNEYDVGISIFNKNDKLFKKYDGRRIAIGRALRRPIMHIPMESAEKVESVVDILKMIENDLRKDNLRSVHKQLKTVAD